jgi:hypothetical protein
MAGAKSLLCRHGEVAERVGRPQGRYARESPRRDESSPLIHEDPPMTEWDQREQECQGIPDGKPVPEADVLRNERSEQQHT